LISTCFYSFKKPKLIWINQRKVALNIDLIQFHCYSSLFLLSVFSMQSRARRPLISMYYIAASFLHWFHLIHDSFHWLGCDSCRMVASITLLYPWLYPFHLSALNFILYSIFDSSLVNAIKAVYWTKSIGMFTWYVFITNDHSICKDVFDSIDWIDSIQSNRIKAQFASIIDRSEK